MFLTLIILLILSASHALVAPDPRLLVLGLGGVGRACLNEATKCGYFDCIQGTSRSPSTSEDIILFTPDSIGSILPECTHVLITIPPPRDEDDDSVFDAVVNELKVKLPQGAWLGFVSTSGVYGNHDGVWVTEESPLYCSEKSPTFRYIQHEKMWQQLSKRSGWVGRTFRCSGLYGPERSALHTLWKKQALTVSPTAGITNRIHETDVARAIVASMIDSPQEQEDFRVYNLSDDEPETRTVVMEYAAELLKSVGVDISIEESLDSASSSARATRRGTDIKRVSNDRMKSELVSELLYPTYREGLTTIFQDTSSPWRKK